MGEKQPGPMIAYEPVYFFIYISLLFNKSYFSGITFTSIESEAKNRLIGFHSLYQSSNIHAMEHYIQFNI